MQREEEWAAKEAEEEGSLIGTYYACGPPDAANAGCTVHKLNAGCAQLPISLFVERAISKVFRCESISPTPQALVVRRYD